MLNLIPEPVPGNRKRASAQSAEIADAKEWLASRISRARKVGLFAEVGLLTPALAQVLLDNHNSRNRFLRETRAEFFAQIIKRGEWMLTTQGISFATDGSLNNGQHRCAGVVRAGQAVPCMFGFGEAPEAFTVIDTQASRTASDVLRIKGEQNTVVLAASAKLLMRVLAGAPRYNGGTTHAQIMEVIAQHPGLREAATAGHRFNHALTKTSAAGASVAYYLIDTRSPNAEKLPAFWDHLCTGVGLTAQRDPVLVLRNAIINGTIARGRSDRAPYIAAGIINAWNLWSRRKQTVSVTWAEDRPFPEVI